MRVIIVEDEVLLASRLKRLCKEILEDKLSHIKLFSNLDDADDYINEHSIDLLFLDLNLKGQDGFQLLKLSVAGSFHTIVVSAYSNRAIEAFEYGVLDFVPKPFTRARLVQALDRMDNKTRTPNSPTTRYLSVKKHGRIELVSIDDIIYVKGAGNYSELYLKDKSVLLHDKSLTRLSAILPTKFERLHKSYIVAMDMIVALVAVSGSDHKVELKEGTRLPVSRSKIKELRKF